MEPTTLAVMAAALLVLGGVAGVLAGLLGVGGGIVLVPGFLWVFTGLGFGGPHVMQVCLATSLATIVVTSARSVRAHQRRGAVDWDILHRWAPGIVAGAVLGVLVAASLRTAVLQSLFAALALAVAGWLGFGRADLRLADRMPGGALRAVQSAVVGFLSVLMGIGGGSFGVPLMTLYGRPIHRAVATAAGFGLAIAVPSMIGFLLVRLPAGAAPPFTVGAVNLPAFALVVAMTLWTAPIGARLAHATDPTPLRRIFAIFLALVALNMLRTVIWG